MPSNRKQKLESLLHREIATCVQQELRDPRLGFITIIRVELSSDFAQLKAYWSILGDDKARSLAVHALGAARGFVQSQYAKAVHTRNLPLLTWVYADEEARRHGLTDLIGKARASDSDGGARPEPAIQAQPPILPPTPPPPRP
jgi:ribosome-binding factor A